MVVIEEDKNLICLYGSQELFWI